MKSIILGFGSLIKQSFPRKFNDFLCLFVMSGIFGMWIMDGMNVIALKPEILGATIAFFTLIGQFYFRKKGPDETTSTPTSNGSNKGSSTVDQGMPNTPK